MFLLAALLGAVPTPAPLTVRIDTSAGPIRARLEPVRAPVSTCNFLRYTQAREYDGGSFFRSVRSDAIVGNPVPIDVIQMQARRGEEADRFGPIRMERTSVTGLRHRAGALSMARNGPDTATSSWSIVVRDSPQMDFGGRRNPDGQGFAVFGQVVQGMDVVRRIQLAPRKGERLVRPVMIRRIRLEHASAGARRALARSCPDLALPARPQ